MSTADRAVSIFTDVLPSCRGKSYPDTAKTLVRALLSHRLAITALRASVDLFTRFHAHCRYLGEVTGRGYKDVYNAAIEYAMSFELWPIEIVPYAVDVEGKKIIVDVTIKQSTTKANNTQLLKAYEYIVDTAKEEGKTLPENVEGIL